jgi:hypothetical protein
VRHWLNACGIDSLHFADQREDAGELAEHLGGLLVVHFNAGQMRDAFNVVNDQWHERFIA